ncbi:right-handed parallel beta-helix repeat-containing protein, partial [uncultured Methanobrevibacter sp.]|uniref:right-handed parallel beta-helix repeat-containing protein n=1 Tax=uncultured Methanobrevibacter sp. TaxID=253161 RepID=UPI0025D92B01
MKYKKSILFIAFLMLVIFLPFVSANELENGTNLENVLSMDESDFHADVLGDVNDSLANSNYTSSQKDDSKLGYSGGEEVLDANTGEYSYEDLKKQINSATGHKITLLKGNYRYGENDGNAIQINKPCEIDGMGSSIYMGLTGCRAFEVSAPGVTLKNLTIFNAQYYGGHGVAIYFSKDGTLLNCNFINSKATGPKSSGGAVYFTDNGTVSNCNFIDNNAISMGGAVYFAGTGTVSNSNFTRSSATDFGGAIYFSKDGNLLNCNFINNKATGPKSSGGAVYFAGTGTVSNCNFFNNEVTGSKVDGSDGMGGALMMKSGSIKNCNFTANKAYDLGPTGGAVRLESGSVTNCNFTANAANGHGGAIYVDSSCPNIVGCIFTKNTAMQRGGAIYLNSRNNIVERCVFDSNSADDDGGAIYIEARYNTIKNSTFVNNKAKDEGGAVYINGRYGKIVSSSFLRNSAKKGYDIYCDSSYCELYCSIILGNTPKNAVYSSKSFSVAKNWWGNLESNRNVKPDVNKKVDLENNWLYLKDEVKYDHTGLLPSAVVKTSIWSNKFNYEVTDCQNIPFDMQFINTVSNQNTMRLGDVSDFIIPLTTTNTAVTLSTIGLTHKIYLKYDSSFYKRSFSHLKYDIYNSSSVLNLTSDYEYMDICDRILINGFFLNKELVIDGNGHTIDGKNIASLFEGSSAKNLTLKNINFVNIKNIYKSNGNIYIENCTFN